MTEYSPLDGELRSRCHVMAVRVYYEDTDVAGIVYHANYLRFMERGRTNYLRLLGIDRRALNEEAQAPDAGFVVRSMQIEFIRPAHMDDLLEVLTEPKEVKGASVRLHQRIMRGEERLIDARVRLAFVAGGRVRPIPKSVRAAMESHHQRP
jgi:acyl-CoA thioester hydrolase